MWVSVFVSMCFFIPMLGCSCCTTEAIFSSSRTLSFRNPGRASRNLRIQSSPWARNVERDARRHLWKSGYFLNVTLKLFFFSAWWSLLWQRRNMLCSMGPLSSPSVSQEYLTPKEKLRTKYSKCDGLAEAIHISPKLCLRQN